MKKIILFLCFLFVALFAKAQLQKQFSAVCSFSGFTTLTDSTFNGNIDNWSDPLGEGLLPSQIQVGFGIIDGAGKMYRVKAINSTTFASANVDIVELQNSTAPIGVGSVFEFMTNGMIPPAVTNALGITAVTRSRIDIHNTAIANEAVEVDTNNWHVKLPSSGVNQDANVNNFILYNLLSNQLRTDTTSDGYIGYGQLSRLLLGGDLGFYFEKFDDPSDWYGFRSKGALGTVFRASKNGIGLQLQTYRVARSERAGVKFAPLLGDSTGRVEYAPYNLPDTMLSVDNGKTLVYNSSTNSFSAQFSPQVLSNTTAAQTFMTNLLYNTGLSLDYGGGTWLTGWGISSSRGQFADYWNYENVFNSEVYFRILSGRLSAGLPSATLAGDLTGGIFLGKKVSGTGHTYSGGYSYWFQIIGDAVGFADANNIRANMRFKQNTALGQDRNALSFLYSENLASIYYPNTRNDSGSPTHAIGAGDANGQFRQDAAWEFGQLTMAAEVSTNVTAAIGQELPVNSTSGARTITAPSTSPVANDRFAVFDSRGTAATNNITISAFLYNGVTQTYVISANNGGVEFTYVNSTIGWRKKAY